MQVALFVEDLAADLVEDQEAAATVLLQRAGAELEPLAHLLAGEINLPSERGADRGAIALQLRVVQVDDASQLFFGDVARCAYVPSDGVAHERIGVDDTPFVQVFEERRQHGEIAGGGVEFEGLLLREVGLEMPTKNLEELVPAFAAIHPHPRPETRLNPEIRRVFSWKQA